MLNEQVMKLKKQLFLEAYRKNDGNMRAVRKELGVSQRQVYNLYGLFTKDELAEHLVTPRARMHSNRNFPFRKYA